MKIVPILLLVMLWLNPVLTFAEEQYVDWGGSIKGKDGKVLASFHEKAKVTTINGQIRIHAREGFADLSVKQDILKEFITVSRWAAVEKVAGSDNLWRIMADVGSVIETYFDPIGKVSYTDLFCAPGFVGKVNLKKGETAFIFGKTYAAEHDQVLVLTWDKVEVQKSK